MAAPQFADLELQAGPEASPEVDATRSLHPSSGEPEARLSWVLLTTGQWLYVCFVLVAEACLIWLASQQELTARTADDVCVHGIAHLMLLSLFPLAKRTSAFTKETPPSPVGAAAAAMPVDTDASGTGCEENVKETLPSVGAAAAALPGDTDASGTGTRSYYVDNVKIFVIQMVLVVHIGIQFGSVGPWYFKIGVFDNFFSLVLTWMLIVGQSFGMSLMFFLSGLFTPSSFERKGAQRFVRERLQRLGWPLILSYFVLSPLVTGLCGMVLLGSSFQSAAIFSPGVAWFLAALVVLSLAYILAPFPRVALALPPFGQIVLVCVVLGAVQGWISHLDYSARFLSMFPTLTGGMPFHLAFFATGCIAKRSGWLEAIPKLPRRQYWSARLLAAVHVLTVVPLLRSLRSVDSAELAGLTRVLVGAWMGVLTASLSVAVLHFFSVHGNFQGALLRRAARSQYGVYVFQTVIIPGVVWTYVKILEVARHPLDFSRGVGSTSTGVVRSISIATSATRIPEELLLLGWVYSVVLVTAISWPLAHYSHRLPVLRYVL